MMEEAARPTSSPVQTIEVVQNPALGPFTKWRPAIGHETLGLLQYLQATASLSNESAATLQTEAIGILSKCPAPRGGEATEAGLAIGYVQSGKTMSFTTVAALARDNGYPLIIIITGISIPLFRQSRDRLTRDLRLSTRADRKWQHFTNPRLGGNIAQTIAGTLADWRDRSVSEAERQTVLVTVMKNHRHLDNLVELLTKVKLHGVPAIIIDDEADQAGLNTLVREGDRSATYRRLLALKRCLPHHSYLQYTATPQAPLLINIIDMLAPTFAEVLTPGPDYVGGKQFFADDPRFVHIIPEDEVPARGRELTEPPESLLAAMRIFFVGVAAGLVKDGGQGNRSMMVHPSQETLRHAEYFQWVKQINDAWEKILQLPQHDPDRMDLLAEFQTDYVELESTAPQLPSFDEVAGKLLRAVRRTEVIEVNAAQGRTPVIDWSSSYSFILVGGQAMDRGFTVEGLTVTYMPRGIGVGNADTVQQRARFFGYKRKYLGYCRLYLERAALDAYRSLVEHEEDIRNRLIDHRATGQPLSAWRRAFFLSSSLRPTRGNVLDLSYMQDEFSDTWFTPRAPHDSPEAVIENRQIVTEFLSDRRMTEDPGHPNRTLAQRHQLCPDILLSHLYERLLTRLRFTRPADSQQWTGLLLQVEAYLEEHGEIRCAAYKMGTDERQDTRRRKLTDEGEIDNLFQGAYILHGKARPDIYPGDRAIKSGAGITVQIHHLTLHDDDNKTVATGIATVAVWVPKEMSRQWLVQSRQAN